jgi:hypothetical protein
MFVGKVRSLPVVYGNVRACGSALTRKYWTSWKKTSQGQTPAYLAAASAMKKKTLTLAKFALITFLSQVWVP